MKRQVLIGACVLVVVVAAAVALGSFKQVPSTSVSNAEDAAIRAQVTAFGHELKQVPLLAPVATRKAAMEEHYSAYVAPELLATWYPEGAEGALGRHTSSPWPDHIEVVEVSQTGDTAQVEANIIEVTSGNDGAVEPAAVQPVTLALEKRAERWLIVGAKRGSYSTLPQRQTVVGYWECLPHKDRTGPQTTECALGIAVDRSDGHYAIDTSLMATYPVDFPTGTKVRVSGVVTPANQLSSIQKYDIDGIIRATTIERVEE